MIIFCNQLLQGCNPNPKGVEDMSKFKISIYAKTFKDRLVEAEMKAIDSFIADKSIVVNG